MAKDAILKRVQLCAHITRDRNNDVENICQQPFDLMFKPTQPHSERKRSIVIGHFIKHIEIYIYHLMQNHVKDKMVLGKVGFGLMKMAE